MPEKTLLHRWMWLRYIIFDKIDKIIKENNFYASKNIFKNKYILKVDFPYICKVSESAIATLTVDLLRQIKWKGPKLFPLLCLFASGMNTTKISQVEHNSF